MFHFMLPFSDTLISPSRDFARYYVWQQMENIISVKFGSFPLYIPAVSGSDFACVTAGLGQLYLPLPYIVSLLPGYWTGYAADWLLLVNLPSITLAHLALYVLLKRLRFTPWLAFALTMVTVYSPRILMCVGYGTGSAAWAGHIFTSAILGLYCLNPIGIKKPLLIIGGTYWLINSGHPEEVYYCMIGTWIFALFLPYVVETSLEDRRLPLKNKIRFWSLWTACCVLAFLLSSAYLVPLYFEAIRHMDFANMSYQQSATSLDSVAGLIYNFFLPTRTGLYGCFGGTSMYLMILLIPLLKFFHISLSRGIWLTLIIIVLVFLYMTGEATPVFSAFWKILPFSSATRNPARAALVMPVVFLAAMIWLFKTDQTISVTLARRRLIVPARSLLGFLGLFLLLIGLLTLLAMSSRLSIHARLNALFIPDWVEPTIIVTGLLTLVTVTTQAMTVRFKTATEVLLCAFVITHLVLVLRYSSTPFDLKHENDVLTLDELIAQKRKTLNVVPDYLFLCENAAHQSELEQFANYFIEPRLGSVYRKFRTVETRQEAYRLLNHDRQRDEVILQGYSGPAPGSASCDCRNKKDRVRLIHSAYNRLVFKVWACQPGFFLLSYADADNHWHARVNDEKAVIYPANGISQAVFIPAGTSAVEFRYWSNAAFWGTAMSCLTLALIGILASLRSPDKRIGFILAVTAAGLSLGLFLIWFHSLYSGKSFNTIYTWESPTPEQLSNLAYGKSCQISARNRVHTAYLHPRRGVDGDRSFYSCFITAHHANPWFQIDLEKVSTVGSIVIATSLQGYEEDKMILSFKESVAATALNGIFLFKKIPVLFNGLPLVIAVSRDAKNWEFAKIDALPQEAPHKIQFMEPLEIRYVRIIASGTCRLCLNEVEVYPPENYLVSVP